MGPQSDWIGWSTSWVGRETGISPAGSSWTGSGRSLSGNIPRPFEMAPRLPPLPAQVSPILLTRGRQGMVSGAGWWIAVVHALHHHAPDPRGGEQVVTACRAHGEFPNFHIRALLPRRKITIFGRCTSCPCGGGKEGLQGHNGSVNPLVFHQCGTITKP